MKKIKILFVDRYLKGRPHALRKEGFEFLAAARKLGYEAEIAGKFCDIPETEIPKIAADYDLIVIAENYPDAEDPWKWWDWGEIATPKCFWAIDTHIVKFKKWIESSGIENIAFNNKNHLFKIKGRNSFWLPYGISKEVYTTTEVSKKIDDVVFIGNLNEERKKIIERYNIKHKVAYGDEYIKAIRETRICFNRSIADDFNAKNMEIIAAGTFLLTNFSKSFEDIFGKELTKKVSYKFQYEIPKKIKFYLENEEEREKIASRLQSEIFQNHTYEARLQKLIIECGF